jgi:hypothetical protein
MHWRSEFIQETSVYHLSDIRHVLSRHLSYSIIRSSNALYATGYLQSGFYSSAFTHRGSE